MLLLFPKEAFMLRLIETVGSNTVEVSPLTVASVVIHNTMKIVYNTGKMLKPG